MKNDFIITWCKKNASIYKNDELIYCNDFSKNNNKKEVEKN